MDPVNSAEMSAKLAKLGLAAVLAYGLFDGVTYTSFFVLAFLGYEKSTGKNPAVNIQALIGIVIMMWTGNNVTRPFRVAGAAALAPTIDNGLRRIQKALNFPTLFYAFALVGCERKELFKCGRTWTTCPGYEHENALGTISMCNIMHCNMLSCSPNCSKTFSPPQKMNGEPKVTTGSRAEGWTDFLAMSIMCNSRDILPPNE